MKIEYRQRPETNDPLSPDPQYAGRDHRIFWAITNSFSVEKTIGYSTQHKELWWCPNIGYTLTEGCSLFNSPAGAYVKAKELLEGEIKNYQDKLEKLLIEALPHLS
jgi:hypothetical protein